MNRRAIALAADSAMTVTYWQGGERVQRYYKGTNKIFQLSKLQPVGFMVHAAANLQGVPWELIVKSYRDVLGYKSHAHLTDYCAGLFEFILTNSNLYPFEYQERLFKEEVISAALALMIDCMRDDGFTKCDNDDEKKQFATRYVEDAVTRVKAFQPISGATDGNINDARSKYQTELCKGLADNGAFQNFQQYFDPAPLVDFAVDAVYKKKLQP